MDLIASVFVGKPMASAAVAALFYAGYFLVRKGVMMRGHRSKPLLAAAVAWSLYAFWEWLIWVRTPEANVRVDLLVIWPVLAILSVWALFRTIR